MASVILVYSTVQIEVTIGTDVSEQDLFTTVGNLIDTDLRFVSKSGNVLTYEVFIISLKS